MFQNREEAGRQLAKKLMDYRDDPDAVVLAIPRGGVPVAYQVASRLNLPLDVIVIKKIGFPGNEEFSIGAAGLGGVYLNQEIVKYYKVPQSYIDAQVKRRQEEVRQRLRLLRGSEEPVQVQGKTVIVIDDGIATGATVRMALALLRRQSPKALVVAVPVAPAGTADAFEEQADSFFCLQERALFGAIGQFYADFSQVDEETARHLLTAQTLQMNQCQTHEPHSVAIPMDGVSTHGILTRPEGARGIVLFVHGSGSGRFSPRNQSVAKQLAHAGFATLLMDLLTEDEEREDLQTGRLRFDIPFLAKRLAQITEWVKNSPETRGLTIGFFGASTGAAAALIAVAEDPGAVSAVVSRGGRPDLADPVLDKVQTPTLLIVGGEDTVVIDLNILALEKLAGEKKIEIIPGATHLFEEPGALEQVASLAANWFREHLTD
jgi:putative phosphoribosyl transferase